MVLHVSLKIEVGKFITLLEFKKFGKSSIRVDLSAILLILKVLTLDVSVDLLAYLGSGHLGSNCLSKESGKFVTDLGWLDKSRWLSSSG